MNCYVARISVLKGNMINIIFPCKRENAGYVAIHSGIRAGYERATSGLRAGYVDFLGANGIRDYL